MGRRARMGWRLARTGRVARVARRARVGRLPCQRRDRCRAILGPGLGWGLGPGLGLGTGLGTGLGLGTRMGRGNGGRYPTLPAVVDPAPRASNCLLVLL